MKLNKNLCIKCHATMPLRGDDVAIWGWGEHDDYLWNNADVVWCPVNNCEISTKEIPDKCNYSLEQVLIKE